jgi:hypothetical protein
VFESVDQNDAITSLTPKIVRTHHKILRVFDVSTLLDVDLSGAPREHDDDAFCIVPGRGIQNALQTSALQRQILYKAIISRRVMQRYFTSQNRGA